MNFERLQAANDAGDASTLRDFLTPELYRELEGEMAEAASKLEFERAALLRDQISELKKQAGLAPDRPTVHKGTRKPTTYPKGTGKRR